MLFPSEYPSPGGGILGSFLLWRLAVVCAAKILHANELAAKYYKERRSGSFVSRSFFLSAITILPERA
jgi:hypothetical protein